MALLPLEGIGWPISARTSNSADDQMKSLEFTLLGVLLAGGLATHTLAEDTSTYHSTNSRNEQVTILTDRSESNLNLKELQDFAQVTDADPNVAPALSKNPALVDNASFVAKRPALAHFLAKYPGADEDVRAHPGNFVEPTNASAWNRQSKESWVR